MDLFIALSVGQWAPMGTMDISKVIVVCMWYLFCYWQNWFFKLTWRYCNQHHWVGQSCVLPCCILFLALCSINSSCVHTSLGALEILHNFESNRKLVLSWNDIIWEVYAWHFTSFWNLDNIFISTDFSSLSSCIRLYTIRTSFIHTRGDF